MRIAFLGNFKVAYSSETHHAKTLEGLGHEVVRLQEPSTPAGEVHAQAVRADMFVWVHTHGWDTPGMSAVLADLKSAGIPSVTYHLDLWRGLKRERDIRSGPYWDIEHFFTVDRLMAEWLCENTPVKGHFLPAGVFDRECYITDEPSRHANDVIFVGSKRYHPEWPWRPTLIDWLRATYGPRFTHVGGDGDTGTLRGDELNRVYANSKVAVGDTLCLGFDYPYYHSDRLFEAPGRGGFQIFPNIVGVRDWFSDDEMPLFKFGDFDALKAMIDYWLGHDEEREAMRRRAHHRVVADHTYRNRWSQIIRTVIG